MLNKYRHHIHVIFDPTDPSLYELRDRVAAFFAPYAFLSHDLILPQANAANFSWRCINECNYVLMLIGNRYGQEGVTGVSQLHVSYLNAKTKHKPLAVLQKSQPSSDDETDIIHADNLDSRLMATALNNTLNKTKLSDLISLIKEQHKIYMVDDQTDYVLLFADIYEHFISERPVKGWKLDTSPIGYLDDADRLLPTITQLGKKSVSARKIPFHNLEDDLMINCTAHAFEDGTLHEVAFMASVNWRELVVRLINHDLPFSSQGLARKLNELVTPNAPAIIQIEHPNAHAISRIQVIKADLQWVHEELANAGWIIALDAAKDMWGVSDFAKSTIHQAQAS